jgi:hypothetical protein
VAPATPVVQLLEVAFDAVLRGGLPVGHGATPLERDGDTVVNPVPAVNAGRR